MTERAAKRPEMSGAASLSRKQLHRGGRQVSGCSDLRGRPGTHDDSYTALAGGRGHLRPHSRGHDKLGAPVHGRMGLLRVQDSADTDYSAGNRRCFG